MIINLPPLESELITSWEQHVAAYPYLANAPDIVRENFEATQDALYATIIFMSSF